MAFINSTGVDNNRKGLLQSVNMYKDSSQYYKNKVKQKSIKDIKESGKRPFLVFLPYALQCRKIKIALRMRSVNTANG